MAKFKINQLSMSKTKIIIYLVILLITIFVGVYFYYPKNNEDWVYRNPDVYGFVPNSETAIKIAEAVWLPIYGKQIESYKPFIAELRDSIWYVKGDAKTDFGGVVHIQIGKKDGKIHKVFHEK
jgi:hypothetical protein